MDKIGCRVLIIGSGPAGASAAYHLSRLGEKNVLMIEKFSEKAYRRYQSICGEAVSDRMMKRAGIETSHIIRRVEAIEIVSKNASSTRIKVSGAIVDRAGMLEELISRSGVKRIRASLRTVSRRPEGGFVAHTSEGDIECDVIIGADGAHSTVRKCIFGTRPEQLVPVINAVVPGNPDGTLRFRMEAGDDGFYSWDFPSAEGKKSIGFKKGFGTIPIDSDHGARCIPIGRLPHAAQDGCFLAGDAAGLPNPLSYGGIGAALVSGRKAAEAAASGDWRRYDSWVDHDRAFDRRFMDAHRKVKLWTEEDIEVAMRPLSGNATILKGFFAMLRHPRFARVYMACWLGFRIGW